MTDEPTPRGPPDSGLEEFVRTRPMLSGFLTFIVVQAVTAAVGGLLGTVISQIDAPLPVFGVTPLLGLAAYVVAGVWGFRLGGGRFLVGMLLPVGIGLLLIGACIAFFITAFSVSG